MPQGPPATPSSTMIRIWSGMSPNEGTTLGGHIPGIVLYDELGRYWGSDYHETSSTIPAGNFRDYKIKGKVGNNVRPSYIQLDARK